MTKLQALTMICIGFLIAHGIYAGAAVYLISTNKMAISDERMNVLPADFITQTANKQG